MTGYNAEESIKEHPKTFTNQMRDLFKGIITTLAKFLNKMGLHANTASIIGLVGNFAAAALLAMGRISLGGSLALIMGLVDAVDGTMARLGDGPTRFGAFLDSVIDRYSELGLFFGLTVYFSSVAHWHGVLACFLAAAGSVLVSYIRARALSLGLDVQIGLLSRLERYLILIPALILNQPLIGMWIIALFANLTALQRIIYVWRQLGDQKNSGN